MVIHAGKGFIQRQQPRAGITTLYVLRGDRSEQRHIHRHGLFPAAEAVKGPVRQFLFPAVSPIKKQVELVPVPVVQHRTDQIRIIDRQPGDLLTVLRSKQCPVLVQERDQLGGIQFSLALRFFLLPLQAEFQPHRGGQRRHQSGHILGPLGAFLNAGAQGVADGLSQDVFKQLPVLILQKRAGGVDISLQRLDKGIEGQLLPALFQHDRIALPKLSRAAGRLKDESDLRVIIGKASPVPLVISGDGLSHFRWGPSPGGGWDLADCLPGAFSKAHLPIQAGKTQFQFFQKVALQILFIDHRVGQILLSPQDGISGAFDLLLQAGALLFRIPVFAFLKDNFALKLCQPLGPGLIFRTSQKVPQLLNTGLLDTDPVLQRDI